jgi:hypothetical protein
MKSKSSVLPIRKAAQVSALLLHDPEERRYLSVVASAVPYVLSEINKREDHIMACRLGFEALLARAALGDLQARVEMLEAIDFIEDVLRKIDEERTTKKEISMVAA